MPNINKFGTAKWPNTINVGGLKEGVLVLRIHQKLFRFMAASPFLTM